MEYEAVLTANDAPHGLTQRFDLWNDMKVHWEAKRERQFANDKKKK